MNEKPHDPRPWSYSREACYRECERRYWFRYIQRTESVPSSAMRRGSVKHALFAARIAGETVEMDADDMAAWNRVESLVRGQVEVEKKIAVDMFGMPVDYESQEAFLRGILDAVAGCLIIDWKMGASLIHDRRQADIYSILFTAQYNPQWPFMMSFMFPYVEPEGSGVTCLSQTIDYSPNEIRGVWDRVQGDLLALEDEIAGKNPFDRDDWMPNPAACSGCGVWAHCEICNGPHILQVLEVAI